MKEEEYKKNVSLTTSDIDAILNAIGVAKDEGYGPEGFGEGEWDEIEAKLNTMFDLISKYEEKN